MRVSWVAIAVLLNALLAGCLGNAKDAKPDGADDDATPVLLMQVRVGDETYEFSSLLAAVQGALGNASGNGTTNATSSGSASGAPSANGTGNQTGNATGNQTGNGTGPATPAARPALPTGTIPLEVTFTVSVENHTGPLDWTFSTGDQGATPPAPSPGNGTGGNGTGGNGTGNATGNQTGNPTTSSTSSTSAGPAANGTGNAPGNASLPGVTRGNTTNATITHTYRAAGDFVATLSLTLRNGTLLNLTAPIAAQAPAGNGSGKVPLPSGTVVQKVTLSRSGTLGVSVDTSTGRTCAGASGVNPTSVSYAWSLERNDTENVTKYVYKDVKVVVTRGTQALDIAVYLTGPGGVAVGSANNAGPGGATTETIQVPGPIAGGPHTIRVVGCASLQGTFTLEAEALQVAQ